MRLRWDPRKWAIDRYAPGSQAPGSQGSLPPLPNSAALWHMSGAPRISVDWAYKSDGGIPREDVCTGASLVAELVKNPSAMEETWV